MRIVLSRKGFDSEFGGVPSPILPGGELLSLPIPEMTPSKQQCRYSDVQFDGTTLDALIDRLAPGRKVPEFVHLDPDLRNQSLDRHSEWRPAFGQALAAESHLVGQGVRSGDLFLFFGWFREVDANWRYVRGAPDLHVLFGWLQVDYKVAVRGQAARGAVVGHPHFFGPPYGAQDAVYVSRQELAVLGVDSPVAGAGVFPRVAPALVLTAPGCTRSVWNLPKAFADKTGRLGLSYHHSRVAEPAANGRIRFLSVARGQEFVIDCDNHRDLLSWLADVFRVALPSSLR